MRKNLILLIIIIFLLTACGGAATEVDQTPEIPQRSWSDVPYTPADIPFQRLDVYLPETGDGPFPTLLAIHGGGFWAWSKSLYGQMAPRLNETGYAVVSTNYRLTPKYSYPAQVEDVFCALAWIHANQATYGFDAERTFVMGDSAGGYLASMLGTVNDPGTYLENCPNALPASDWLQGVVVLYGMYDFTSVAGYQEAEMHASLEPFLGAAYDEIPLETLVEMSPMSRLDGSEPPFLLIHGTLDTSVPSWMSEDFSNALEAVGGAVKLVLLEEKHGFLIQPLTSPANVRTAEEIQAFLSTR
jgi:acetyl esterase/lipase